MSPTPQEQEQEQEPSTWLTEPLLEPNSSLATGENSNNIGNDEDDNEGHDNNPSDSNSIQRDWNFGRFGKINHNVALNLILCLLYGVSDSLWDGTVIAAYLKTLGRETNKPLGDVEAVNGIALLLTALPIGYLADRIGRAKVIAAGGVLIFITTICHVALLEYVGTDTDGTHPQSVMYWMGAIMAMWGIAGGVVNGPCAAIFADSTPEGQRSMYYTYLFACYEVASSVGPLVSIGLFQSLGDTWDLYHLRIVIYVGLIFGLINAFIMMFFDDKKSLDESEEEEENDAQEQDDDDYDDEQGQQDEQVPNDENDDDDNADVETGDQQQQSLLPFAIKGQKWIPYIIFSQGLIFALGSGMTVKFFPLFFKDTVGMTPSQVQFIYVLVPICMVITSAICTKVSGYLGRPQTCIIFASMGISLLFVMIFFVHWLEQNPFWLVPIYVLRTSFMNGVYPIQESMLMDFVPKQERATWKSLDSVAAFGWCGSAAVGGWLSDKYDYTYTFLITALMQSFGTILLFFLIPLVPRQEGSNADNDEDGQTNGINEDNNNDDGDCLQEVTSPVTTVNGDGDDNALTTPLLEEK